MSCILVTRMYILSVVVALESPCGAIPSYVLHTPHIPAANPTAAVGISGEGSALLGPDKIPRPLPRHLAPAEGEFGT